MNWDRVEGGWKQLAGKVREQWGKLTDDDMDVIAGKREQLAGKLQQRSTAHRPGRRIRGRRARSDRVAPSQDSTESGPVGDEPMAHALTGRLGRVKV